MQMFALFGAKCLGFFGNYGVSELTREGGAEPARTFCGQVEG